MFLTYAQRAALAEIWEQHFAEMRAEFRATGTPGKRYSPEQVETALRLVREKGVRRTAHILHVPRRTLQRWCRSYEIDVPRVPEWVIPWAMRRRRARAMRGAGLRL